MSFVCDMRPSDGHLLSTTQWWGQFPPPKTRHRFSVGIVEVAHAPIARAKTVRMNRVVVLQFGPRPEGCRFVVLPVLASPGDTTRGGWLAG